MTSAAPLVLVVEDEPKMRRLLRVTLESNGMRYAEAMTAREAVSKTEIQRPDLIVADLGLPDGDGLDLIRRTRSWSAVPIVVLSARAQESDKVAALDSGADDYVTKPFATGELLARLRVALRHGAARMSAEEPHAIFEVRELHVDLLQRRVRLRGEDTHLTPIEYRLLTTLIRKAGQVVTHAELLREVWGPAKVDQQHYLRIYMAGLRRKLEVDSAQPVYLLTETGVGYRLIDE
jgi:two-component system, OmpR family, KDP operon response regulator KdpE